ncbi:MAG: prephenate dehydrogenase [Deltaproteobacteria bacterium]|nr:MAG: prephenate dehydrogenase [Deltaproteobacteria bacterium]
MAVHFQHLTVIGVGLIGGSLAMALRERGSVERIIGVGRGLKNLERAKELGIIDSFSHDPKEGSRGADLVVVATPVRAIPTIIKQIAPELRDGTLITDVGSVKQRIMEEVESFLHPGLYFVGGHPLAGMERSGAEAASARLFQGSKCILTPSANTNPEALEKVTSIWKESGMEVVLMDAQRHDRIVGVISHLPHIVASGLVHAIEGLPETPEELLSYAAGGFNDTTRVASSHPEIWRDICLWNREAVLEAISQFELSLGKLKRLIEEEDQAGLLKELEEAKKLRDQLKRY